ncbi:MAG: right-handed parallel beta-helix repeat-containing protein [Planctomycetota bacterium]
MGRSRVLATGLLVIATSLAVLVGAVTIQIDDQGEVTVYDPDQRVHVVEGDSATEHAETEEQPVENAPVPLDPFAIVEAHDGLTILTPQAESWPAGADVLVLAWSQTQRQMVDDFALRFQKPPIFVTESQLRSLPSGAVELQALWRIDGETRAIAKHPWASNSDSLVIEPAELTDNTAGFTDWPLHPDARRIHIASTGQDEHDGLTPEQPVRTLRRGLALMRSGYGDQVLLRAGDTFSGGIGEWRWSGRDAQYPALLGVYGEGPRPRIITQGEGFLTAPAHAKISFVAFQGLDVFPARRTPGQPSFDADDVPYREGGLWWMARGEGLWIEDCRIAGFQFNVVLQSNRPGEISDAVIRRCILVDSFSHWDGKIGGHSSGLFAMGVNGLLVEDSVFDHNGWAPRSRGIAGTKRTKFNHNLYLQQTCRNLTVRNNVIARGASYGLQLRPGGEATGNLFARNAMGMYFAWHPSRIVGNVVVESVDQGDKPDDRRGYGIEAWPCEDGLIAGNLLLHKRGTADWAGAIEVADFGSWEADIRESRVAIHDNTIVGWPVRWERDSIVVRHKATDVGEANNVLDVVSGGASDPRFVRPGYTIDEAAGGSFEAWLSRARDRTRGTWPAELTAGAINQKLFDAYEVVAD